MRKEYLQYWKQAVMDNVREMLPDFSLGKTPLSKVKAPSLNRTEVHYHRRGEGDLTFYLSFHASRSDSYKCLAGWAEDGKRSKFIVLDDDALSDNLLSSREAWIDIQELSYLLDPRESRIIGEWKLTSINNANELSDAQLFSALLREEEREIPDEEARERVQASVAKAVGDVHRLFLPWFARKAEFMREHAK